MEDEAELAATVAIGLRREGMAVDIAIDGLEAIQLGTSNDYDVIVLDRDLPELHGDDVCRHFRRERPSLRILMLTASTTIRDLVYGLELGADDYLVKPFAFAELVARLRAVARRPGPADAPVIIRGPLFIEPARRLVLRDGRRIELTAREFTVLQLLASAQGRIVSPEELLERAWDMNADPFSNAIRMTMMRLRRKLGDPPLIETVVGAGYRL